MKKSLSTIRKANRKDREALKRAVEKLNQKIDKFNRRMRWRVEEAVALGSEADGAGWQFAAKVKMSQVL